MTADRRGPMPGMAGLNDPAEPIDRAIGWGSDVAAQMLRRLDIPYIALTPGSSFRGLHDSLVNHLGNRQPRIITCLHEEHAVAIAHGYAKVTGRAMAVALHSNVGLMHAAMAIFNAWCDRQPMLILAGLGPLDAARRRPRIDWIHTAQDQAALVRPYLKWDDQPGSVVAMTEALLRGWQLTSTAPYGPVCIGLDVTLQEARLDRPAVLPDPARYRPAPATRPNAEVVGDVARRLTEARRPVILFGRCRRSNAAWNARVALAEKLGAAMLSDLKAGSMVPTDHPLHAAAPFNRPDEQARATLRNADLIVSIGWIDLGGLLDQVFGEDEVPVPIIHASQDQYLHRGWGKEHMSLPPIDLHMLADPDACVGDLLAALPDQPAGNPTHQTPRIDTPPTPAQQHITYDQLVRDLKTATNGTPVSFASLPRGWPHEQWPHTHPLAYLGKDGGGGVGSGPGITIGAALADDTCLTIGVLGDGDVLMGINAIWTAAHHSIPALIIVANNRSYHNDMLHQEAIARRRGRNAANSSIGQQIRAPAPDIAQLAQAQGVDAIGPVTHPDELAEALVRAVRCVKEGRPCLIDVHIDPPSTPQGIDTAGSHGD